MARFFETLDWDDGSGSGGSDGRGSGGSGSCGSGSGGSGSAGIPCFLAGTDIDTANGPIRVEDIRMGDRIVTRDDGLQPVIWVGGIAPARRPHGPDDAICPILIAPGTFGPGSPERPLLVSRQHRLLLSGPEIALHFALDDVLAPAVGLVHGARVRPSPEHGGRSFHHLLFARHQVIRAENCWSESLFPGDMALTAMSPDARQQIADALGGDARHYRPARPFLTMAETRLIARLRFSGSAKPGAVCRVA